MECHRWSWGCPTARHAYEHGPWHKICSLQAYKAFTPNRLTITLRFAASKQGQLESTTRQRDLVRENLLNLLLHIQGLRVVLPSVTASQRSCVSQRSTGWKQLKLKDFASLRVQSCSLLGLQPLQLNLQLRVQVPETLNVAICPKEIPKQRHHIGSCIPRKTGIAVCCPSNQLKQVACLAGGEGGCQPCDHLLLFRSERGRSPHEPPQCAPVTVKKSQRAAKSPIKSRGSRKLCCD